MRIHLWLLLTIVLTSCATASDEVDIPWDPIQGDSAADGAGGLTKREIFERLDRIAEYDAVELRSDVPIEPAASEAACALARRAYTFDIALQGLGASPAFVPPLVLGLGSPTLMGGHNGAATISKDAIVAALVQFVPSSENGTAHYVLGHELTHLIMFRMTGNLFGKVPIYLFEGIATSVGLWFTRQSGITAGWPFDRYRSELGGVTRNQVEDTFEHFRKTSDYSGKTAEQVGLGEHVGGLFVEYLRLHVRIDTHHRFGRVWERLSAGESLDDAMQAEFGATLGELEVQFADFIEATATDPALRLAGTVLDAP